LVTFLLYEKLDEKIIQEIKQSCAIGINKHEMFIDIANFDNTRLQKIADFVVDKVKDNLSNSIEENNQKFQQCEYINGKSVNLPEWFIQIQGHKYEDILKNIFPPLKKYQKEDELKKEILKKVVDDMPELLSKDFIPLFQKIQNVNFETQ
jgi:hypothetical protein